MDELSAFLGAPPELVDEEKHLLRAAALVFTGGTQLYESKRRRHPAVYRFPSSVDKTHFARARSFTSDPADQASIGTPRLGWFGVIDERLDRDLVAAVAAARPDWQLVLIGPVVKIDPDLLPTGPNIHYLGPKPYDSLPDYLTGWDVGIMPFARNDSTRFISPTKTPEYLAAGLPVVSTPIADVIDPYGRLSLVGIAGEPAAFVAAVGRALRTDLKGHRLRADSFLSGMSWDSTWAAMDQLITAAVAERQQRSLPTVRSSARPNAVELRVHTAPQPLES